MRFGNVLITGATGGLARLVAERLKESHELVGADARAWPSQAAFPGEFVEVSYTHRKMTDVFRKHRFHTLIHMGRIRTTSEASFQERYNVNVLGTRNLLDLAKKYGVKNVVVFSTFHVYGAHRLNPMHITEDQPLRASQLFPELQDAVDLDHYATNFLLQNPNLHTVILRPTNVVGSRLQNDITKILKSQYCPMVMGFDPMMQFVDQEDMARAIILSMRATQSGIYNVIGEGVIPYSHAINLAGGKPIPIPPFVAYPAASILKAVGMSRIPKHLIDYIRFPVLLSDEKFRKDFRYEPLISCVESLKNLKHLEN